VQLLIAVLSNDKDVSHKVTVCSQNNFSEDSLALLEGLLVDLGRQSNESVLSRATGYIKRPLEPASAWCSQTFYQVIIIGAESRD
jgi:hypothetical protein